MLAPLNRSNESHRETIRLSPLSLRSTRLSSSSKVHVCTSTSLPLPSPSIAPYGAYLRTKTELHYHDKPARQPANRSPCRPPPPPDRQEPEQMKNHRYSADILHISSTLPPPPPTSLDTRSTISFRCESKQTGKIRLPKQERRIAFPNHGKRIALPNQEKCVLNE